MRHLINQPHIIFSVENSPYPDKVQVPFANEEAIQFLKQNVSGGKVYSLDSHYGKPEKSILITDPSDEQKEAARTLTYLTGQDSHIESDGYTHKMIYNHGPNSGKVVMGRGTTFHESKPKDMYSVLPDGTVFTHNFDFENSHVIIQKNSVLEKAKEEEWMSPEAKRSFRSERKKFSPQDPLASQLTSDRGVSETGIEARRADNRILGAIAHGYARVSSPEFHAKRAKTYARETLEDLRSQPKPNLPKSEKSKPKFEPLMKPYVSEAQRRWAHTPAGMKALGGKKTVEHWDKESKGKDLPEKIEKALSPEELKAQGYTFKILKPTKSRDQFAVRAYHGKKAVGHLVFSGRPEMPSETSDSAERRGYHAVTNGNISEDHQGKGLYQHMIKLAGQHAKSLGSKGVYTSGSQRSNAATRAWQKVASHGSRNPYVDDSIKTTEQNADFYLAASEQMKKGALPSAPKVNINPEHGKKIADAYHNMKHDPNLDPKHHEKLVNDEYWGVRSAIAQNPSYIKYKQNEGRGIDKNMQDIQSMDRLVKSRLERRSGLYLGKSWQAASAKDNREGRSLDKAIDPNSFKKIKNSHDKVKSPIVDNNAHGANHPMTDEHFLDHIVKSPQIFKDQSKSYTKGISSKNIFDIKSYKDEEGQNVTLAKPKTFMIKPYYGHLESSTKTYTKNPIKGWATLTTKNLLHAADMGHMAEDVSYYEHQGVPVTVHKFNHDYVDLPSSEGKAHPLDIQKIAIMDYLTNNVDRHANNIMLSKDKFPVHRDDKSNSQKEGFSRPLLIDHERNFQYNRGIRNKFGKNDPTKNKDAISDYLWNSSLGSIASKFEPYEMHEHADDLADWWNNNSKKIEETFDKNLAHIKDEGLKNHIASNFKQRMKSVHDVFNNENYYEMFSPKSRLGEVNVGKTKYTTSKVPKKLAASEEGLK
jgi:hypothetical protein